MNKFLSIRWNDETAPKPRPIIGYSVHTDIAAAQEYITQHRAQNPTHRPELLTEKGAVGAREIILSATNRLRAEFEDAESDGVHDVWVPVSQKPGQQSLQLRSLHAALHADGASEHRLPLVLIPAKS